MIRGYAKVAHAVAGIILPACLLTIAAPPLSAATPQTAPLAGPNILGWGTTEPGAVAIDGTHVWVSSPTSSSITEYSESTGAYIKSLLSPSYGFIGGIGPMTADQAHLWVVTSAGLDEISTASGSIVKVIPNTANSNPANSSITDDGTNVWLADQTNSTIHEIDASSGDAVQSIPTQPDTGQISSDGTHVFLTTGSSVNEYLASTGALVRTVSYNTSPGSDTGSVASTGAYFWVTRSDMRQLLEFDASSGTQVRAVDIPNTIENVDGLSVSGPTLTAVDGTPYGCGGSSGVATFSASTGVLLTSWPVAAINSCSNNFPGPAFATNSNDIWLARSNPSKITEYSLLTGSKVTNLPTSSQYHIDLNALQDQFAFIVSDASHVWYLDGQGGVGVVNASTGAFTTRITSIGGKPLHPIALSDNGTDVFIENGIGQIVELDDATGGFVQLIKLPSGEDCADDIAASTKFIWSACPSGAIYVLAITGSFSENAMSGCAAVCDLSGWPVFVTASSSGAWSNGNLFNTMHLLSFSPKTGKFKKELLSTSFRYPVAMTSDASNVFVVQNGAVTRVSASTGDYAVRQPDIGNTDNGYITGVATDGTHLWSANMTNNTVVETTIATGKIDRVLSSARYGFSAPQAISVSAGKVWVLNNSSITEFPAT